MRYIIKMVAEVTVGDEEVGRPPLAVDRVAGAWTQLEPQASALTPDLAQSLQLVEINL